MSSNIKKLVRLAPDAKIRTYSQTGDKSGPWTTTITVGNIKKEHTSPDPETSRDITSREMIQTLKTERHTSTGQTPVRTSARTSDNITTDTIYLVTGTNLPKSNNVVVFGSKIPNIESYISYPEGSNLKSTFSMFHYASERYKTWKTTTVVIISQEPDSSQTVNLLRSMNISVTHERNLVPTTSSSSVSISVQPVSVQTTKPISRKSPVSDLLSMSRRSVRIQTPTQRRTSSQMSQRVQTPQRPNTQRVQTNRTSQQVKLKTQKPSPIIPPQTT